MNPLLPALVHWERERRVWDDWPRGKGGRGLCGRKYFYGLRYACVREVGVFKDCCLRENGKKIGLRGSGLGVASGVARSGVGSICDSVVGSRMGANSMVWAWAVAGMTNWE